MTGVGAAPRLAVLVAVLGLGCRPRVAAPVARTPLPLGPVTPATGAVAAGVYTDHTLPVRWVVPAGWSARAGEAGKWRVRLQHAETGVAWELWAGVDAEAPCPDGWWATFSAIGPFRGPASLPEAQVATCLSAPSAGAVWTWRPLGGPPWALRLWLPSERAAGAVDAALDALTGLEWGAPA